MRPQLALLAASILALPATAAVSQMAPTKLVVPLKSSTGQDAGKVTFKQTKKGLKITVKLENTPFGMHGVHVHANPVCDAPDFKTAGGHFNPDSKQHGFLNPMGHHAGDMPASVDVGENHQGEAIFTANYLTLTPGMPNSVYGHSIVVHEKADDEKTDPSGASGNRIACGVIPPAS
jgi:Cu-Zn family superoxide dismutase